MALWHSMVVPPKRPMMIIAVLPGDLEDLRAGKRVTKSYPEPLPYGWRPEMTEAELEAMRAGKHVMKAFTPDPSQALRVGNILHVSSHPPPGAPPPMLPDELGALLAGKVVTKAFPGTSRNPKPEPELEVKVVAYEHRGEEHLYTLEAA